MEPGAICCGGVEWSYKVVDEPGPRKLGSSPYSKKAVVGRLSGLTVPAAVAAVPVALVGAPPDTAGGELEDGGGGGGGGGGALYVNRSAALVPLVPPGVVTVTSTVPEPGGEVAVICVELTTATFVAPFAPKATDVAPVRFVPVIVTLVPPDVGPEAGLMPVTVGGGGPPC